MSISSIDTVGGKSASGMLGSDDLILIAHNLALTWRLLRHQLLLSQNRMKTATKAVVLGNSAV